MPAKPRVPESSGALRQAECFDTRLPVAVEGGSGSTHNISDSGVYFETDIEQKVGSLVNLTLEFQFGGKPQRFECQAEVVRIQQLNNRIGIAARLQTPLFGSAQEEITL